jgi:hypothetical protein
MIDMSGSASICFNMVAGQKMPAGTACVTAKNGATDSLLLTYDMGSSAFCLSQVHAWAGTGAMPEAKPGLFPSQKALDMTSCVKTAELEISLPAEGQCLDKAMNLHYYLLAHASVFELVSGNATNAQTA